MQAKVRVPYGVLRENRRKSLKIKERKWRTVCDLCKYFSQRFEYPPKPLPLRIFRFNPILIAEWLEDLLPTDFADQRDNRRTLGQQVGLPQYRVSQYLALLNFPGDLRQRLRDVDWVAEGHLRPFTRMTGTRQRKAVEKALMSRKQAKQQVV